MSEEIKEPNSEVGSEETATETTQETVSVCPQGKDPATCSGHPHGHCQQQKGGQQ